MTVFARTYLVEGGQTLKITGDERLHQRYEHLPVVDEVTGETVADAGEDITDEELVEAIEEVQEEASSEETAAEEAEVEPEEDEDRPAGNASKDEWYDYRLANSYSEEELEDLGRDDLRDLEDR